MAQSQNLIINERVYKPGIYKTFEEFKFNNPSFIFNYSIEQIYKPYGSVLSSGSVNHYRMNIDKPMGKSIGSVFGFSDGTNIYVNTSNSTLSPKLDFYKIDLLGQYCYYEFVGMNNIGGSNLLQLVRNVIDIESGKVTVLGKKEVKKLIAKDKELVAMYEKEEKKLDKSKEYIKKYNERFKSGQL
ncbi:hypothetical protein GCM10023183_24540 [Nibribacter koreensis]|uniref:Uncharacterized protein n=2 Tax=Nibribacter koreensis TaxID=1084519 RepID=A0ABP8FP37_9BACT